MGGGPGAGMRRGREQEEIQVKTIENQEKGEILAKMIEEEKRGWIRAGMKGDLEVGTEEKRETDPEVMKGKEKITEEIEDKKMNLSRLLNYYCLLYVVQYINKVF